MSWPSKLEEEISRQMSRERRRNFRVSFDPPMLGAAYLMRVTGQKVHSDKFMPIEILDLSSGGMCIKCDFNSSIYKSESICVHCKMDKIFKTDGTVNAKVTILGKPFMAYWLYLEDGFSLHYFKSLDSQRIEP